MWNVHPRNMALFIFSPFTPLTLSLSFSCLSDERQADLITHNEFHLDVCGATGAAAAVTVVVVVVVVRATAFSSLPLHHVLRPRPTTTHCN
ncbi:hypothetical protein E2C01_032878 [Portunus trituberculatus]|uniref:Secreted peptide n=1 Tax=Portunus trituberculatus TaxID=210409 RepID=A0A5B7F442_PORTR|nr:hypothetical protein [Portunus trituberculatus]